MLVACLNCWNLLRFIPLAIALWAEPKKVGWRKCTYWIWLLTNIAFFMIIPAVAGGAGEAVPMLVILWLLDTFVLCALDKWQKELSGKRMCCDCKSDPNKIKSEEEKKAEEDCWAACCAAWAASLAKQAEENQKMAAAMHEANLKAA